jgi:signal recognition particle subunit SRP54
MPGMGMGKRAKGKQAAKKSKSKRVSGNPAKRAEQAKAAADKPSGAGANPFGLPQDEAPMNPDDFKLPADLSKYLK